MNTTAKLKQKRPSVKRSCRGSAVILVVIVIAVGSLLMATYMKLGVYERSTNIRNAVRMETRLAVESALNYAAAEIAHQYRENPLTAEDTYTNTILPIPDALRLEVGSSYVNADSLKITVAAVPSTFRSSFVDSNNPANAGDPMNGQIIQVKDVRIFAEATGIVPGSGSEITEYAELSVEVRDRPFLSYAIFYNMDMEIMPENLMEVHGPVHTNYDLYVSAAEGLDFFDRVSATDRILHGTKVLGGEKFDQALGPIRFPDEDGNLVAMKNAENTNGREFAHWLDNNDANSAVWNAGALERWDGNVQDGSHEVPRINLPGFDDYVENDPDSGETLNHAYAMIEPVFSENSNYYKGEAIRQEKMAWKAGLILRVEGTRRRAWSPIRNNGEPNANYVPNSYSVTAHRYVRGNDGSPQIDESTGLPMTVEVKLPAGVIGEANGGMTAIASDATAESYTNVVGSGVRIEQEPVIQTEEVESTRIVANRIRNFENARDRQITAAVEQAENPTTGADNVVAAFDLDGRINEINEQFEERVASELAKDADGDGRYTFTRTRNVTDDNGDPVQALDENGDPAFTETEVLTNYHFVEKGFMDHRQQRTMDALYVDLDALRQYVSNDDGDYAPDAWQTDHAGAEDLANFDPSSDWNGVVYIETPTESRGGEDLILEARDENLGVVLINGEDVPNRTVSGQDEGFSLATNAPVYMVGSYNADGDLTTGSATAFETGEVPSFIAADSFTSLSSEFADSQPIPDSNDERGAFEASGRRQLVSGVHRSDPAGKANTPVEISAGLFVGITPTVPNDLDHQSGGAHNFIRFLQDWAPSEANAPTEFLYRGAMIALFENEVHTKPIRNNYRPVYSAPNRTMGYNDLFRQGDFSEGSSNTRTYWRGSMSFPSKSEYQEGINGITANIEDADV